MQMKITYVLSSAFSNRIYKTPLLLVSSYITNCYCCFSFTNVLLMVCIDVTKRFTYAISLLLLVYYNLELTKFLLFREAFCWYHWGFVVLLLLAMTFNIFKKGSVFISLKRFFLITLSRVSVCVHTVAIATSLSWRTDKKGDKCCFLFQTESHHIRMHMLRTQVRRPPQNPVLQHICCFL